MLFLRIGLLICLIVLWLVNSPDSAVITSAETEKPDLMGHFRETAVGLLRHTKADRHRIILPYWNIAKVPNFRSDEERESWFGDKLWSLESPEILKVTWSGESFQHEGAPPRVSNGGDGKGRIWLFLGNKNRRTVEVRIYCTGTDGGGQSIKVPPSGTRALLLQPNLLKLNSKLELRLSAGEIQQIISLPCEPRRIGHLSVTIRDETGTLTPARIYLTDSGGVFRPPLAERGPRIERVSWVSGENFFYADGNFQADLPEGATILEVVKGAEYLPSRQAIRILGGEQSELKILLRRLDNPGLRGWFAGDEHVHANYRSKEFVMQPQDVALIARGEDLHVINLMVSNSDGGIVHDQEQFQGGPHPLSTSRNTLYWNQEMRNYGLYGHLVLLNLKQLIRPIYTGFPGTEHEEDYPTNVVYAQNAHQQGGLVSYAHPGGSTGYHYGGADAHEAPVDVALRAVDAFEVFCSHSETSLDLYYRLLNCGFPLAISAGSDAFLNQTFGTTPGGERVYVYASPEFTYQRWIEGLKAGRTFATEGPLLDFRLQNKMPGERLQVKAGHSLFRVSARSWSWLPMERLEVVVNGKVIAYEEKTGKSELHLSQEIELSESAWVAARVWGPPHRLVLNEPSPAVAGSLGTPMPARVLLAHSSPVYVEIDNRKIWSTTDARYFEDWIERLMQDVRTRGVFREESRRQEVIELFRRAQQVYRTTP